MLKVNPRFNRHSVHELSEMNEYSVPIAILDRAGTVLYESPETKRMLGVDERNPRVGSNFFGFCHPEDIDRIMRIFSELIRFPRESRKIIFRLTRSDGTWLRIESVFRNLLHDPGVNGVIVGLREISDTSRVGDRSKIFEHIVENVDDAVVVTDLRNYIQFVNQSFCDVYGYTAEELIGEHASFILSSKNPDKSIDDIFSDVSKNRWEGELVCWTKDGTGLTVHMSASRITDESGNPTAIAGIIRDHTQRNPTEEYGHQSEQDHRLGLLVGGIAHNFNNILGVIMGYSSLLEDPGIDREKFIRHLRIITEATERGAHLVTQLMTYLKKSPVRFEDVSVNEMIGEISDIVLQTFPREITVSVDADSRNPIVHADRDQFRQLLLNLLYNARDAMPRGGSITVVSDIEQGAAVQKRFIQAEAVDYVRISVRDTGTGMDENIRRKIFDPFFTTKESGKGFGMGLPMVCGIAESHNGFIDADSTMGEGSTFSVYLPLKYCNASN